MNDDNPRNRHLTTPYKIHITAADVALEALIEAFLTSCLPEERQHFETLETQLDWLYNNGRSSARPRAGGYTKSRA